jgi:hypothetical protein
MVPAGGKPAERLIDDHEPIWSRQISTDLVFYFQGKCGSFFAAPVRLEQSCSRHKTGDDRWTNP